MNREQFYLGKVAEEASEVAQSAMKCQQFGLANIKEGTDDTNISLLLHEFNDLCAMIEEVTYHDIKILIDYEHIMRKKEKTKRYRQHCLKIGATKDE